MPDEHATDFVPDYVSADVKRQILALTEESEPEPAPLEVNEYLIRHWCEALEDGNPLYLDEAYARSRSHTSIVAPPASLLTTFLLPLRWPWPAVGGREPRRFIHYDLKELLDLPVGIVTDIDVEYYAPVFVGDLLNTTQRLVSVSEWKRTRVGEGHFWTIDRTYRNQNAILVARERMTIFSHGRGGEGEATSAGGWSAAVEEMIGGVGQYLPPEPSTRYWEDVAEGEQLPPLLMPITTTRCVYLASATRDFSPQHSNRDYAQQRSMARDIFVNTPFNMGMVSRFMTDWGGPLSTVRRMKLAMRGNVCAGDDMTVSGTISKKYIADGEHRVDIEIMISTRDGPMTPVSATLALPSMTAT